MESRTDAAREVARVLNTRTHCGATAATASWRP